MSNDPLGVLGGIFAALATISAGCAASARPRALERREVAASLDADADLEVVPAGPYVAGSTAAEREAAYDEARATAHADHARRGRWFDREEPRHRATLPAFWLDRTPVTQRAYAEFVRATGRAAPAIDEAAWNRQRLVHPWAHVLPYLWRGGRPPARLLEHPVVLVDHGDAEAYCRWRGEVVGRARRLPTAAEYEKASRGASGLTYPYGERYDPSAANDGGRGQIGTTPVTAFAGHPGPYGHLDLAGNVFEWSATPWPGSAGAIVVKGGSWDDHAGVGRGAQRHPRPRTLRHVLLGFRCAADAG